MARKDRTQEMIEEVVRIGRENLTLMPLVQNWCRHLQLKPGVRGMVAPAYNVPNWFELYCPHASGGPAGVKLAWIAQSFISESCINCRHHDEISKNNFGRKVMDEIAAAEKLAAEEAELKKVVVLALKARIAELLKTQKITAETSELSILSLLDKLESLEEKEKFSTLVFEASKLEPSFFTALALEILSLYSEDEKIGGKCIESISNILEHSGARPTSIMDAALACLVQGLHFDQVSLLLRLYVNQDNKREYEAAIKTLLDNLRYLRMLGEPGDFQPEYKNSVAFFSYLVTVDREYVYGIVKQRLYNPDLTVRYNINGLLQELIPLQKSFVISLLADIILSLEVEEDGSYQSADQSVLKTILLLLQSSPRSVMKVVKEVEAKLSTAGRISLLPLTRLLIRNEVFCKNNQEFIVQLIAGFINSATSKSCPAEVKKAMLDEIGQMSGTQTILFEPHFDLFLGLLTILLEDLKQFQFWKKELETKKREELHSFNPLATMDYWSVSHEDNIHHSNIRNIKNTIGHLIRLNEEKYFCYLQPALKDLNSKTQPELKTQLISILRTSLKDPFVISLFIPQLYNFLLDPVSLEVRDEALKMLHQMISKYPSIVTETLFGLVEAFMSDPEIIIKKRSLEIIGAIAENVPEQLLDKHIAFAIESLNNKYVFIHKAAAGITELIYPYLNEMQVSEIVISLFLWEQAYYKENDYDFCSTLSNTLLHLTKNNPQRFGIILKATILKYCANDDHYFSEKSLDHLTEIKNEFPEFEGSWLEILLDKLGKTHYEFGDNGEREKRFNEMYNSGHEVIIKKKEKIVEFLATRTAGDGRDIISILFLLLYYELFEEAKNCSFILLSRIKDVKSNEGTRQFLNLVFYYASYETSRVQKNPDTSFLKKIEDAFKEI